MDCCQAKRRAKKRTSSELPLELSDETNDVLAEQTSGQSSSTHVFPRRCMPLVYATVYFICMVISDFTIEGTQNAFPDLPGLPYCMTLFQFSFCLFLPVAISKGKTLQKLPRSIIAISPYVVLSLVVFSSNVCKSASARYVSFPTKVIFRSTKLIPVMIVASMFNIDESRKYGKLDYLAASFLCAGAAGYSLGEHSLNEEKKNSYFGLLLLTGSVLCDAFTPNIKQWLMNPAKQTSIIDAPVTRMPSPKKDSTLRRPRSQPRLVETAFPDIIISDSSQGTTRKQVIAKRLSRKDWRFLNRGGLGLSATELMTNAYAVGCVGLLAFMVFTGHLGDAVGKAFVRPHLFANLTLIGLSLSIAVFAQTRLIKESGAVIAVTVTTLREFATVLLSYLIYPKIFSTLHAISALSVFGGIVLTIYSDFENRSDNANDGKAKDGASPPISRNQSSQELEPLWNTKP
mmetsp:Transcript_782/g.1786  ORF Transcript_782/g.1786 Transcript_782/m.1786 type:complete len:458 (-) Transcript_782:169-1542(-)